MRLQHHRVSKSCEYIVIGQIIFFLLISLIIPPAKSSEITRNGRRGQRSVPNEGHRELGTNNVSNKNSSDTFKGTNNSSNQIASSIKIQPSNLSSIKKHELTQDQFGRNAYNVSIQSLNFSLPATTGTKHSNETSGELSVADSHLNPRLRSSRLDDDIDSLSEEETPDYLDDSVDGASSNMNEQKVVKELTKILSKGMSGATDQMKLETLENWKRRQKERKVLKDNRAKLFEDLLTTAINSHSEKLKKKGKKQAHSKGNNEANSKMSSANLLGNSNVDPELAVDAETVLQHLQGLASAIDTNPSLEGSGSFGNGEYIPSDDESLNEETSESPNETSNNLETEKKVPKKSAESNDRPIVRQFKKIKQQISQRRKQLDQIKKIFNVELAVNPKDGSLMGKSATKKKESQEEDSDDYSPSSKKKVSNQSKSNKMRELMVYLKENPDILASVMEELSSNSDIPRSNNDENSLYSSALDQSDFNGLTSRRSNSAIKNQDIESLLWESKIRKPIRLTDTLSFGQPELPIGMNIRRTRSRNLIDKLPNDSPSHISNPQMIPPLSKPLSAESLLLESLRERQLMNLARLDRVLAERHQASNRSQVYSALNSSFAPTSLKQNEPTDTKTHLSTANNVDQSISSHQHSTENISNNTPKHEVLHHFIVMNPGQNALASMLRQAHQIQRPQQFPFNPPNQSPIRFNNLQSTSLSRFKEWRDVSQSETSPSQQLDKPEPSNNITWVPYDLSTGSSLKPTDPVHRSSPPTSNYRQHYQRPIVNYNDLKPEYRPIGLSSNQQVVNYADLTVTRPGVQSDTGYKTNEFKKLPSSTFMTRSSFGQSGMSNTHPPYSQDNQGHETSKELRKSSKGGIRHGDIDDDDDGRTTGEHSDRSETLMSEQGQSSGPVDYFSAYKHETVEDNGGTTRELESLKSKEKRKMRQEADTQTETETDNDTEKEDMGAIWAR